MDNIVFKISRIELDKFGENVYSLTVKESSEENILEVSVHNGGYEGGFIFLNKDECEALANRLLDFYKDTL